MCVFMSNKNNVPSITLTSAQAGNLPLPFVDHFLFYPNRGSVLDYETLYVFKILHGIVNGTV